MSVNNKRVTFPYAIKTIAVNSVSSGLLPYSLLTAYPQQLVYGAEMALLIYPPLFTYKPQGLFMHLIYQFGSEVAVADQIITRIYCRDTSSYKIGPSGSSIENYMDVNLQADVNRKINVSLDLSSIMTGKQTNVVALRFHANNTFIAGRVTDNLILWKLDLVYQTIGIRDEK